MSCTPSFQFPCQASVDPNGTPWRQQGQQLAREVAGDAVEGMVNPEVFQREKNGKWQLRLHSVGFQKS